MSSPPSGGSSQPLPAPAARTLPEDWLTAAAMALLALITFANVLVRYFTDASFAWTEEISVFLMIVLALVGGVGEVALHQRRLMHVEQVATEVGFGSALSLRQHFASQLHTSPSAYRRLFCEGQRGTSD